MCLLVYRSGIWESGEWPIRSQMLLARILPPILLRLFDLLPRDCTGPPSYYVVHAWGAPFLSTLEQVLHHLTPPGRFKVKKPSNISLPYNLE